MRNHANRTPLALAGLCLMLAAGLGWVWLHPPALRAPPRQPPDVTLRAAPAIPFTPLPLENYEVVTARPLFHPGRRLHSEPEGVAERAAVVPELPPPAYQLVGVVIVEGRRMALLREAGSDRSLRVLPGEDVGGWTVERIEPAAAILVRGHERHVLPLVRRYTRRQ